MKEESWEDTVAAPRLQTYHDAATSFRAKGMAAATARKELTPQRRELQKHLECDVLLACAATRSRSRRSDLYEDTAAATARKK